MNIPRILVLEQLVGVDDESGGPRLDTVFVLAINGWSKRVAGLLGSAKRMKRCEKSDI